MPVTFNVPVLVYPVTSMLVVETDPKVALPVTPRVVRPEIVPPVMLTLLEFCVAIVPRLVV